MGHLVTIIDPTHPLFERTLRLVQCSFPRRKSDLVVSLPNGEHRSVPRSATDFGGPPSDQIDRRNLPLISVRTILPVAQFVRSRLHTTEEMNCVTSVCSSNPPSCAIPRRETQVPGRQPTVPMEPVRSAESTTVGSTRSQADPAHPTTAARKEELDHE